MSERELLEALLRRATQTQRAVAAIAGLTTGGLALIVFFLAMMAADRSPAWWEWAAVAIGAGWLTTWMEQQHLPK